MTVIQIQSNISKVCRDICSTTQRYMNGKVNAKQVKHSYIKAMTDECRGLSTFFAVHCGYQWIQEGGLANKG